MKVQAFRITQTRFVESAFDGEGARRFGGRWNSTGTSAVYVASSLSLATLEILVHIEDISTIDGRYTVIPVDFDDKIVKDVAVDNLPANWNSPQPIVETQLLGDRWVHGNTSAVLRVPSAVTPGESNYLLNPLHRDFKRIKIQKHFVFELDPRLKPDD